jgi:hypothetical protein
MRCERCANSPIPGWIVVTVNHPRGLYRIYEPCGECIGGISSCCDAAGSGQPETDLLDEAKVAEQRRRRMEEVADQVTQVSLAIDQPEAAARLAALRDVNR